MGHTLQWKLKGANVPYTTSRLVDLPCAVLNARQKLKEECGLQHVTAIEYILYNDDEVLPNEYILQDACQVEVARCKSSDAQELMKQADEQYKLRPQHVESDYSPKESLDEAEDCNGISLSTSSTQDKVDLGDNIDTSTNPMNESSDPADMINVALPEEETIHPNDMNDHGYNEEYGDEYYQDSGSNPNESDEDSRIQAVMQQRDFYGGESTETLSHRYYRKRTFTATEADSEGPAKIPWTQVPSRAYVDMNQDVVPVDENYICHMCGQRGHHIKNCLQPDGKRLHKKIRPATGIPVDFLQVINEDDINNYDEVYHMKTGEFAVMKDMSKVSGGAFFTKSADQRIQCQLGITETMSKNMVKSLRCIVCNNFFNNPVTTMCCGESFCLDCVVDRSSTRTNNQLSYVYHCPKCKSEMRYSDLQANTCLKNAIESLVLHKEETTPRSVSASSTKPSDAGCVIELDHEFFKRQRAVVTNYLSRLGPRSVTN
ncbi:hypothetical protein BBOV_III006140 [Babesia bovis T2Bo]|uniref:hypothetical protein n=1 Tax=Babesia bovis T2Bo TaxID=484906 RepID=UPI001C347C12|nr:hypothetical protein BBOV_III006140 [Babesia bovis T2Bo]EDO08175.2 hypothetical protein BBOV_III006140 [Babesia bovis T2Bo]